MKIPQLQRLMILTWLIWGGRGIALGLFVKGDSESILGETLLYGTKKRWSLASSEPQRASPCPPYTKAVSERTLSWAREIQILPLS